MNVGSDLMTCFQRMEYGKGKVVMLQWSNSANIIHLCHEGQSEMSQESLEEHFTLWDFFPKPVFLVYNHLKKSDEAKRGHSECLAQTPQTIKIRKQEKTEKPSQ